MMKLTMAVFALLSLANGIQTKEDNIQQLPEVESEADTSEIEAKKFKKLLATAKRERSVPVKSVMN